MGLKEAGDGIDCCNLTFIISKLILDFFAFGKNLSIAIAHLHRAFTGVVYLKTGLIVSKPRCPHSSHFPCPLCMTFDHEACGRRVTTPAFPLRSLDVKQEAAHLDLNREVRNPGRRAAVFSSVPTKIQTQATKGKTSLSVKHRRCSFPLPSLSTSIGGVASVVNNFKVKDPSGARSS